MFSNTFSGLSCMMRHWPTQLQSLSAIEQGIEFRRWGSNLFLWTGNFLLIHTIKLSQRWKWKRLLETALEWKACLWRLLWVNRWVWPEEGGCLLNILMDFTLCFRAEFCFYSSCLLIHIYKRYKRELSNSQVMGGFSEQCPQRWCSFPPPPLKKNQL